MSKLLIGGKYLIIDSSLAVAIGLTSSIILLKIIELFDGMKLSEKNLRDGKYWIDKSYHEWQEDFPFLATNTIRNIFKSLSERGLIIFGNFTNNRIDSLKQITINEEALDELKQKYKHINAKVKDA